MEEVVYTYKRKGYGQSMYIVMNLSENYYQAHSILLKEKMIWKEILSSNSNWYGGDREDKSGQWIEAHETVSVKQETEEMERKDAAAEKENENVEEEKCHYEMIIELEPLTAKIYEVVR